MAISSRPPHESSTPKANMPRPIPALVVSLSLFVSLPHAGAADYWNQMRGPSGDGHADASDPPIEFGEDKNLTWKTSIHGKAWSSPVVWGDQIWLTTATADGKRLSAVCVDAKSGKITRDITVFEIAKPMYCHPYNSYASPTPVIAKGSLWVHYGSAGTACVDTASGKVRWTRQDFPCNHHRGPGSSPIVYKNLLLLTFDGFDQQYLVALNKETGATVWRQEREINYRTNNGDAKKSYGTPTVIEHGGRAQLISPSAVATISYNPLTAEQNWIVYHGGFNAAARPLYAHGLVYLNLEGGMKLLAVRPDGRGDVTKTHIDWTYGKGSPTRPSQLIVGDHLYMVNDKGVVSCLDARKGKMQWTKRMGGAHSASPLFARGRIYFCGEDGKMRVIAAAQSGFKMLAENELAAGCMASPAVIGDALLIRTKTHLYRFDR